MCTMWILGIFRGQRVGIGSTGTRDYEPFCASWAWNWALCKGNSALDCGPSGHAAGSTVCFMRGRRQVKSDTHSI